MGKIDFLLAIILVGVYANPAAAASSSDSSALTEAQSFKVHPAFANGATHDTLATHWSCPPDGTGNIKLSFAIDGTGYFSLSQSTRSINDIDLRWIEAGDGVAFMDEAKKRRLDLRSIQFDSDVSFLATLRFANKDTQYALDESIPDGYPEAKIKCSLIDNTSSTLLTESPYANADGPASWPRPVASSDAAPDTVHGTAPDTAPETASGTGKSKTDHYSIPGLDGVWILYKFQALYGASFNVMLTFKDDTATWDVNGVKEVGIASSKQNHPEKWGIWEPRSDDSNNALAYQIGDSKKMRQQLNSWPTEPAAKGSTLSACYKSYNSVSLGEVSALSTNLFCFSDNGYFSTTKNTTSGSNAFNANAKSETGGTYTLDGYNITLDFGNGVTVYKVFGQGYKRVVIGSSVFIEEDD